METKHAPLRQTARGVFAALGMVSLFTGSNAALAATATDTMGVSATVVSACILDASDLAFGNYDPTSASAVDATTTVQVTCTTGTSFTVGLNAGLASGATVTTRKLQNGANLLAYQLYSNAGRTTNWGNTPGTDTPAATVATTTPTTLTVYGRLAALQNVPAGSYSDTVTVTVNY